MKNVEDPNFAGDSAIMKLGVRKYTMHGPWRVSEAMNLVT